MKKSIALLTFSRLHLHVPFLNLIANLVTRGGKVQVRVGGNTQDFATLVMSTPDGRILEKYVEDSKNPVSDFRQFYTDIKVIISLPFI